METHRGRVLWDMFRERVEPLVRIIYRWQMSDLMSRTMSADTMPLSNPERALVDAIYYASANSMTNDQCMVLLQMPKTDLLAECQTRCELSLLGPDLFNVRSIWTIKAIIFYIVSRCSIKDAMVLKNLDRRFRTTQHAKPVVCDGHDFAQRREAGATSRWPHAKP